MWKPLSIIRDLHKNISSSYYYIALQPFLVTHFWCIHISGFGSELDSGLIHQSLLEPVLCHARHRSLKLQMYTLEFWTLWVFLNPAASQSQHQHFGLGLVSVFHVAKFSKGDEGKDSPWTCIQWMLAFSIETEGKQFLGNYSAFYLPSSTPLRGVGRSYMGCCVCSVPLRSLIKHIKIVNGVKSKMNQMHSS